MKRLSILFNSLLIASVLLVGGCSLEEEPYGFYNEANFFSTPEDAESALLYAYNALTFIEYSRGIFYIGELASETCNVKADEGYGSQQLNNWTADANNETLTYYFKYCFIAINRANAVIENVTKSDFSPIIKNKLLGEAYFLRAYSYFNLVKVYGLVPIQRTLVKSISEASPNMATNLDDLYNFIHADLRTAEEYLTINPRVGRADKIAAQALMAKTYLTVASSKESGVPRYVDMAKDVQVMYDSAAYYAGKVIFDQSTYSLDPDLMHIYDVEAPNGPEHIFIMSMDRTGLKEGNYSKICFLFQPWMDGSPFYLKNTDNSLTFSSNGFEVFQTTREFQNSYATTDKRRKDLLVTEVFNASGQVVGTLGNNFSYAFTRKYVDPKFVGQKTSSKPYLIRFSDIALVYAEAAGPTTEGYTWLNRVRTRAGLPNATPGMGVSDFRNAVVQERAWELAFEGQRLYDLRRKSMVTFKDLKAAASGITEAAAAFYPIPQVEIDLNPQ